MVRWTAGEADEIPVIHIRSFYQSMWYLIFDVQWERYDPERRAECESDIFVKSLLSQNLTCDPRLRCC